MINYVNYGKTMKIDLFFKKNKKLKPYWPKKIKSW